MLHTINHNQSQNSTDQVYSYISYRSYNQMTYLFGILVASLFLSAPAFVIPRKSSSSILNYDSIEGNFLVTKLDAVPPIGPL